MQIHELNNFTGTLGSGAYLAVDDGNDTGKLSTQQLLAATEARIDNIIAGPAPSAEEIVDARRGADGVTYNSLGTAIRTQVTDLKSDIDNNLHYPSLSAIPTAWANLKHYVKYFALYGDRDAISIDDAKIWLLGYYNEENTYYIAVRIGSTNYYLTKSYTTKPSSGNESAVFDYYLNGLLFLRCHIIINWSLYNDSDYILNNSNMLPVHLLPLEQGLVYVGNNTNLRNVPVNSILQGTFVLDSGYTLSDGQRLIGDGATITVASTGQMALKGSAILDGITFVGDWTPTRTTQGDHYTPLISLSDLSNESNDALFGQGLDYSYSVVYIQNTNRNAVVRNCSFRNLKRPCITIRGGSHRDDGGCHIVGNSFSDCWNGINVLGEFTRISQNTYFRCVLGLYIKAGNLSKVGEIFKGCDCSIFYPSDATNGAHGEAVGLEIAHSGIAGIYAKKIDYQGDFYTGCHIVDSPIIAEIANYLMITSGKLDTFVKIDSGSNCAVMGNMVSIDYIGQNPLYTVPSGTYIKNNVPMRNATESQVNNIV